MKIEGRFLDEFLSNPFDTHPKFWGGLVVEGWKKIEGLESDFLELFFSGIPLDFLVGIQLLGQLLDTRLEFRGFVRILRSLCDIG